jgi:RNA-directed DNA polymerase
MVSNPAKRSLLENCVRALERAKRDVLRHARKDSFGVDNVTAAQFEADWGRVKKQVKAQLLAGEYSFEDLRGVAIRKNPNLPLNATNVRPISIPTIRDRVVQRAMLAATWVSLRDRLHTPCSFGGIREYRVRKGPNTPRLTEERKNVRLAAERIITLRAAEPMWVFETDIVDFFGTINRDRLISELADCLPDDSLLPLFENAINVEIGNIESLGPNRKLWDRDKGIPQGSVLSPLLANFYLHKFDGALTTPDVHLIRYIDDLVILTSSQELAESLYDNCEALLRDLGLSMHPMGVADKQGRVKTRLLPPGEPFEFLGLEFTRNTLVPKATKWDGLRSKIDALTDAREGADTLASMIVGMNRLVRGWVHSFSFCNLDQDDLRNRIDRKVFDRMGGWLRHHGFTKDRNCVTEHRARLLGLKSSLEIPIRPIMNADRSPLDASV